MLERQTRPKAFRWQWEAAIQQDYRIPSYALGTILLMAQFASTKDGTNLYKAVVEVARMRQCDPDTMGDHIKIAVTLGWFVNEGRIKNRKSNTYHLAIPADHPVYVRVDAMAAEGAARRALADKSGRKPLVAVDISPRFAGWDPASAAAVRERRQ